MFDWVARPLSQLIGPLETGKRPAGGVSSETEGVPSLGGENIDATGKMSYSNVNRISPAYARLMKKGKVKLGDTLINKDGAQTGKVAQYDGRFADAWINEHVFIVRSDPTKIDAGYLFYSLLDGRAQNQIARRITGSAQPGLNSDFANAVTLQLPRDVNLQAMIACILRSLDALIEATEELIAKQEQVRAGLMQGLFTRGVDDHGQLRPPREEAPHLYHQTELGWLPKRWGATRLSHLTSRIVDGVHHTPNYVSQGVPFITVKSLTAGRGIDTKQGNFISLRDHRVFQMRADPRVGDVLVSKDGTLGVARYVDESVEEFSIFVSVAMLRPVASLLHPAFLCEFFGTGFYEAQMGYLSAGSGLKHIHLEHFRKFVLPLPKLPEQRNILAILGSADQCIVELEDALEKLRLQKSGLLHDLLTGKVSVMRMLESAAA